jgi:hypothetical protein
VREASRKLTPQKRTQIQYFQIVMIDTLSGDPVSNVAACSPAATPDFYRCCMRRPGNKSDKPNEVKWRS